MSTFALIMNGAVAQIASETFPVHPDMAWTGDIGGVSPAPQCGWPAAEVAGVWTFTAPVVAAPTLVQLALGMLMGGLTIALSGTMTLAETVFPTDPVTTGKIGAVITIVGATGSFANGATTWPMKDAAGNWHDFTIAQYKAVAEAIANFVSALDLIIDGHPDITALPPTSISVVV